MVSPAGRAGQPQGGSLPASAMRRRGPPFTGGHVAVDGDLRRGERGHPRGALLPPLFPFVMRGKSSEPRSVRGEERSRTRPGGYRALYGRVFDKCREGMIEVWPNSYTPPAFRKARDPPGWKHG